jgi:lysophospholipase L1-like esterase
VNSIRSAVTRRYSWLAVAGVLLVGVIAVLRRDFASAAPQAPRGAPGATSLASQAQPPGRWIAAWAASPQAPSQRGRFATGFDNQTVRNIVFSTIGGSVVRVRFTNRFGAAPLQIGRATVALRGSGARLAPSTARALTFAGRPSVAIPPGADALSDPVALILRPMQELAISAYLPRFTGPPTEHGAAQQLNYVAANDHAADPGAGAFTTHTQTWYLLDDVDVFAAAREAGTVVALGDSITDGVGSVVGANARWPNQLARRLQSRRGTTLNVVDEGIGGNRVLNDSVCCGVNAVARFGADVLARPGVRAVILLEGVNDIGFGQIGGRRSAPHRGASPAQIIAGYGQIIAHAHAAGLSIFGATLTPFRGARYWSPRGEAEREAINRWIATSGAFDGVIDFARVLAASAHPEVLDRRYDSGDHLHPNGAGYRAMAAAVNVAALLRSR